MQDIVHKKGKIYYTMGEVSEMFDVKPSLLRFWEREFDILTPARNKKGNRLYTPQDVDNIKMIYHLLKERNMKIEVARKCLKNNREDVSRDAQIMERLMNIRSMLAEIKADLSSDGIVVEMEDGEPEEVAGAIPPKAEKEAPEQKKTAKKAAASPEKAPGTEPAERVEAIPHAVKPPFEEQPLFEILPYRELVDVDEAMDAFIAKHYDEEGDEDIPAEDPLADFRLIKKDGDNGEGDAGQSKEEEQKPRPSVIEQTLF